MEFPQGLENVACFGNSLVVGIIRSSLGIAFLVQHPRCDPSYQSMIPPVSSVYNPNHSFPVVLSICRVNSRRSVQWCTSQHIQRPERTEQSDDYRRYHPDGNVTENIP